MLSAIDTAKQDAMSATSSGRKRRIWMRDMRSRNIDDGQPSSTTIKRTYETAAIMNATPPGDPATCDALSAANLGYRAPNPVARPASAKLINVMPAVVTIFRNGA